MNGNEYVVLAYGIALVLLGGYALNLCVRLRALNRRQSQDSCQSGSGI